MSGRPRILLIDATAEGLDEAGLRSRARAACVDAVCSSRSYRHPFALVACHDGAVGVDIERLMPFDARFAESIVTPRERERLAESDDPALYVTDLWSGKEALAKALGDPIAYDPRRLDAPGLWPEGRSGRWRAERLPVPAGHVGWVCWAARPPSG